VQGTEFFNQQFAGDQFQLEIERALHKDLYGFLLGHGSLSSEWVIASSAVSFAYLIGDFTGKLDWEKEKGRGFAAGGQTILAPSCILTR
jgi:hypothetical protein